MHTLSIGYMTFMPNFSISLNSCLCLYLNFYIHTVYCQECSVCSPLFTGLTEVQKTRYLLKKQRLKMVSQSWHHIHSLFMCAFSIRRSY